VTYAFYGLDVLSVAQPTVSKYWKEHKALTLTSSLTSSFLHSPRKYSRLLALAIIKLMRTDHDRLLSKLIPNNLKVVTCSTETADVDKVRD